MSLRIPVSSATLAIMSSFSLARITVSKYELLDRPEIRIWPLKNLIGSSLGFVTDRIVGIVVGVEDLLHRSRAMTRAIAIVGTITRAIVGGDSEGKIPLTRISRMAYAAPQKSSSFASFI